jgi:hypothetical protein
MRRIHLRSTLFPNLLLAGFLVAGQWGALVHAFKHEAGKSQTQVCATCVAASQLGFACIDTSPAPDAIPSYSILTVDSADKIDSVDTPTARQRGPPSSI